MASENEIGVAARTETGHAAGDVEGHAVAVFQDVVVLNAERPVLGKGELQACADRAAKTRAVAGLGSKSTPAARN